MVNSEKSEAAEPAPGARPKRQRLIDAAAELFHHHGVAATSIADVATAADVPVGGVYYYFKSKDALIDAVVDARVAALRAGTAELEQTHADPADRLKAWFDEITSGAESIARYGCPYGTLCTELSKTRDPASRLGTPLLEAPAEWAARQFEAMGRTDGPQLGVDLMMAYQGATVLAHALSSLDLLHREADRVHGWVDSLTPNARREIAAG